MGDLALCNTDGTASGNQAAVRTKWNLVEKNLVGAVIGPASATDGVMVLFDGVTGKLIKAGSPPPANDAGAANNFLTAYNATTGAFSHAQPSEANLSTTDITTNNVSTTKHGLTPKVVAPATGFLNALVVGTGETIAKWAALFDNTVAEALGVAAAGVSLLGARRDHVHPMPSPADVGIVLETNAEAIFGVTNPGSNSTCIAKLNGNPTNVANSICTFDTVTAGGVGVITPTSTGQLAKMRIYNLTRGTSALILSATGSTFTVTTNVYVAGWRDNDDVTIASQTLSGGGQSWVDLEVISGPIDKTALKMKMLIQSGVLGDTLRIHPCEAGFSTSKYDAASALTTAAVNSPMYAEPIMINNLFCLSWVATSTGFVLALREAGYTA